MAPPKYASDLDDELDTTAILPSSAGDIEKDLFMFSCNSCSNFRTT